MDLKEVSELTEYEFLGSSKFPYRTGQLHDNFFSKSQGGTNSLSVGLMDSPKVQYGKVLEKAPAIRYGLKRRDKHHYSYTKYDNKHFRYIERIIEEDVIPMLENEYGVKRV